jgi:hypothetical protein
VVGSSAPEPRVDGPKRRREEISPSSIGRNIVDRVNKALEEKHVELSWGFIETLSHVFELPDAMASARAIDLHAQWGSLKITSEALVLATSLRRSFA